MSDSWPSAAVPREWVEDLFDLMLANYGNKFVDMWRGIDLEKIKRTWAAAMGGLSEAELRTGCAALLERETPPTLPQFVKLCRPALDPIRAYYEAIEGLQARARGEAGVWSHPSVFWAATEMHYELRTYSFSQVSQRWEKTLREQMAKAGWDEIPAPRVALPPPAKSNQDHAAIDKARTQIYSIVGRRADDREFNHKHWALRIMERAKQPNHGLSAIQINNATEALKNYVEIP